MADPKSTVEIAGYEFNAVFLVDATTGLPYVASGGGGGGGGGAVTVADGADVTLGAKADAKSTATDTTPVTAMQVLKQISASVQAPPAQAVTQSGTWTVQPGNTANTTAWKVDGSAVTQPVSSTTLATAANQTSANTKLDTLHTDLTAPTTQLPAALGVTTAPGALPVVQADGAQVSGTISAAIPASTVTITNASPGVFTWTSHGRSVNDALVLTTGGTLPAPLVAGNTVYVLTVLDANTFTVALTPGGAAVNTTSAGSGTQTATASVLFQTTMDGYGGLSFAYGPSNSANFIFEQSEDQSYWFSTMVQDNSSTSSTLSLITTTSGATNTSKYWPKKAKYFRIRCTTYTSGTTTITGTKLAGSPGAITATYSGNQIVVGPTGDSGSAAFAPMQMAVQTKTVNRAALATDKVVNIPATVVGVPIVRPYTIPEAEWYASSGTTALATTTATQLVAAAGAGIRNYVTGIQLVNTSSTVSTTATISDGTSNWTCYLPATTAALPVEPVIVPPNAPIFKGAAATALTITLGTTSANVYYNAQGFQAP